MRIVKFLLTIDGIDLDAMVEDNESGKKRNWYKTRDERVSQGKTALELSLKCAAVHQVIVIPHSYHLALPSPAAFITPYYVYQVLIQHLMRADLKSPDPVAYIGYDSESDLDLE